MFSEGELDKDVVVAKFATTTQHGAIKGKTQTASVEYYNLDVIISVGYRVKSKQSHDRFLIVDSGEAVYHIGASLKDLGKKWFAFSKMDKDSVAIIINAVTELG